MSCLCVPRYRRLIPLISLFPCGISAAMEQGGATLNAIERQTPEATEGEPTGVLPDSRGCHVVDHC